MGDGVGDGVGGGDGEGEGDGDGEGEGDGDGVGVGVGDGEGVGVGEGDGVGGRMKPHTPQTEAQMLAALQASIDQQTPLGRPSQGLDVRVTFKVTAAKHQQLVAEAKRRHMSLSEYLRKVLP